MLWPLYPGEISPSTCSIGGWVGLRAGLNAVQKRKITCTFLESNPGRPARNLSLYWLSYSGSQKLIILFKNSAFGFLSDLVKFGPELKKCFSKTHFNIAIPSMTRSPKWYFQTVLVYASSLLSHMLHIPPYLYLSFCFKPCQQLAHTRLM
jgi:hypothetical protein